MKDDCAPQSRKIRAKPKQVSVEAVPVMIGMAAGCVSRRSKLEKWSVAVLAAGEGSLRAIVLMVVAGGIVGTEVPGIAGIEGGT